MEYPFARHVPERCRGYPAGFPVQLKLKTERFRMVAKLQTEITAKSGSELLSFPAGKHDDQVDVLGLIVQVLDKMRAGQKPKEPKRMRGGDGDDHGRSVGADSAQMGDGR